MLFGKCVQRCSVFKTIESIRHMKLIRLVERNFNSGPFQSCTHMSDIENCVFPGILAKTKIFCDALSFLDTVFNELSNKATVGHEKNFLLLSL